MNQQVIAVAVIKNEQTGKYLFPIRHDTVVTEIDGKHYWPGGKVEFGEQPHEAVQREIKEEFNLDIIATKQIAYIGSKIFTSTDTNIIVIPYICKVVDGNFDNFQNLDKRHEVCWLTVEQILMLNSNDMEDTAIYTFRAYGLGWTTVFLNKID